MHDDDRSNGDDKQPGYGGDHQHSLPGQVEVVPRELLGYLPEDFPGFGEVAVVGGEEAEGGWAGRGSVVLHHG